jgi:hypothetical protein
MTITITKRGYWCLRVVYTSCQGLESDGRNYLAAIVPQSLPFKNAVDVASNEERFTLANAANLKTYYGTTEFRADLKFD